MELTKKYIKIRAEVDDEVYLLTKRIQFKFQLTWGKARDFTNRSLKDCVCGEEVDDKMDKEVFEDGTS